jgi:hypothetical protein
MAKGCKLSVLLPFIGTGTWVVGYFCIDFVYESDMLSAGELFRCAAACVCVLASRIEWNGGDHKFGRKINQVFYRRTNAALPSLSWHWHKEGLSVKRRLTVVCLYLGVLGTAPAMFADITDYLYNLNGTSSCPASSTVGTCSNYGGFAAVPGLSSSLDTSDGGTGLGSLTLTFNPGAGSYNVGLWLFEQLQQPGWNEYGSFGGTPVAGQSWQVDVPDYDYNSSDPNFGFLPAGAGTIVANTQAGTLSNTNYVVGNNSEYVLSCTGDPTCNDYVSMAMAFGFTLTAGQEEVVTFNVSASAPTGGFYLEQIHPADGANTTETDYFLTGSAAAQPVGTTVPEPGSGMLVGALVALVLSPFGRRLARQLRTSGPVLDAPKNKEV